ncbi:MAG: ABC transporter permease subunit [Bacteriovorax sp.]|nr:ABC transporter permease subunit [Bacteriovorax sp.]
MIIKEVLENSWASFFRVLCGGSLAFFIGILFGLIRFSLPDFLKRNFLFNLILDAPKFPPPIAWIPFVILAMGIGEKSAWAIVFIGVFPAVATNTYEALSSVKVEILKVARSLELSFRVLLLKVYLPAILPQVFTGLRVGLNMGWMSIIAAEMISGSSGLGYSIQLNRLNLRFDLMIVDMVLISLIGFFINWSVSKMERRVVRWNH